MISAFLFPQSTGNGGEYIKKTSNFCLIELHRLLSTLLSRELTVDEKLGIIEKEYSIVVDDRIREDVSTMCNLSQGIREKGGAEREEKIILNMHRKGYTLEQIAECVEKTIEEVEAVIRKREPVLA